MIGTSFPELLLIITSILSIRAITPLSVVYIVFCAIYQPRHPVLLVLLAYACAETAFYLFFYLPWTFYLQRPAVHPPRLSRAEREELFSRCSATIADSERYLRKWFLDADIEGIKRDNLKEFYAWAFLNCSLEQCDESDHAELDEYVRKSSERLGRKFENGRGSATCLKLSLDRERMTHRPLLWYMIIAIVDAYTAARLRWNGFTLYRTSLISLVSNFPVRLFALFSSRKSPAKNFSYWYRPHKSTTKLPVLFIHGIGIGLYPYVDFLASINQKSAAWLPDDTDEDVGVIAVEIMPISARISGPMPCREETCAQIREIVQAHGWDMFVLVANSYGTVVSTHLLKDPQIQPKIGPVVLIDPVVFLLHLPDVAYNFTYRAPKQANERQLSFFASKDANVAHTLFRHFFWSENILWREDLGYEPVYLTPGYSQPSGQPNGHVHESASPEMADTPPSPHIRNPSTTNANPKRRDVTIALSSRDLIVPVETVGRYLAGPANSSTKNSSNNSANNSDTDSGDDSYKSREWTGSGLEIVWLQGCDHAQGFEIRAPRRRLVEVVRGYVGGGVERDVAV